MNGPIIDAYNDAAFGVLYNMVLRHPGTEPLLKTAEVDAADLTGMPDSVFAWPEARKFPIHTKEATVLSALYAKYAMECAGDSEGAARLCGNCSASEGASADGASRATVTLRISGPRNGPIPPEALEKIREALSVFDVPADAFKTESPAPAPKEDASSLKSMFKADTSRADGVDNSGKPRQKEAPKEEEKVASDDAIDLAGTQASLKRLAALPGDFWHSIGGKDLADAVKSSAHDVHGDFKAIVESLPLDLKHQMKAYVSAYGAAPAAAARKGVDRAAAASRKGLDKAVGGVHAGANGVRRGADATDAATEKTRAMLERGFGALSGARLFR